MRSYIITYHTLLSATDVATIFIVFKFHSFQVVNSPINNINVKISANKYNISSYCNSLLMNYSMMFYEDTTFKKFPYFPYSL